MFWPAQQLTEDICLNSDFGKHCYKCGLGIEMASGKTSCILFRSPPMVVIEPALFNNCLILFPFSVTLNQKFSILFSLCFISKLNGLYILLVLILHGTSAN